MQGLWDWGLAVTYFHMGNPYYHRRRIVSPSCSGWEGVGPTRYGRQTKRVNQKAVTVYDSNFINMMLYRFSKLLSLKFFK